MIRFLLTLLILLPAFVAGADTHCHWTHLFTSDGIDVYREKSSGTRICTFKGVGHIDAGMGTIASVLQDIPAYNQWVPRCRETRVLKEVDGNISIFYSVANLPPPYKDRDMILVNKTIFNPKENMVEISFDLSDQGGIPAGDKYVRVKEFSGRYLLEFVTSNKTRITFEYRGNPGGNIPVCLANWLENRQYAFANISGLRKMIEKRKRFDADRRFEGKRIVGVVDNTINQGSNSRPSIRLGRPK